MIQLLSCAEGEKSILLSVIWRAVGPFGHRYEERRDGLWIALRGNYRGAAQVGAPSGGVGVGDEEHQMRMPVAIGVRQVSLLRHHERHCSRLRRHEGVCIKRGFGAIDHAGL